MKSCNVLKKRTRLPNTWQLYCDFNRHIRISKSSVNVITFFFFYWERRIFKTNQPTTFVRALGASAHVSHLVLHWLKRYGKIDAFPIPNIWCKPLFVRACVCVLSEKRKKMCATCSDFFMTLFSCLGWIWCTCLSDFLQTKFDAVQVDFISWWSFADELLSISVHRSYFLHYKCFFFHWIFIFEGVKFE